MAETDQARPQDILVETRNLTVRFPVLAGLIRRRPVGAVTAVDRINLQIRRGETLGLVGESGCGKSTLARAILRLVPPTSGEVLFDGAHLEGLEESELRPYRRRMQIIFQDPFSSLNPRMTVGEAIAEAMLVHGLATKGDAPGKVAALLGLVGLTPSMASRFPHEFSGGQRQRIGIARVLAVEPDFIACDEPVSALDVSIQAQIVNLLDELRARLRLTYLFVSHDLAVVRHISDRVAVMYLGQIVEIAPKERLYIAPLHPYTQALLSAVPVPSRKVEAQRKRQILEGEVPSPLNPPQGCRLHPRCPHASPFCRAVEPVLEEVEPGHWVACHLHTATALMVESVAITKV
jgi:oligopeptide transport system ATP-binding protein